MEQNKETIMKDNNSGAFMCPPANQIKTILVDNCRECPFEFYNEGYSACNLNMEEIDIAGLLPDNKVHDKCPLKNMNHRIRLR